MTAAFPSLPASPDAHAAGVGNAEDLFDSALVQRPPERLALFNAAGLLDPGDVHAAAAIARLAGATDDDVLLAIALAVRAPRYGHTCVDLATVADTITADDESAREVASLPWPEPATWRQRVAASAAVADAGGGPGADHRTPADGTGGPGADHRTPADGTGDSGLDHGAPDDGSGSDAHDAATAGGPEARRIGVAPADRAGVRPLRLHGSRLYLERYWRYERRLAGHVTAYRAAPSTPPAAPAPAVAALLANARPEQRAAIEAGLSRRLTVIAGGPGTGKTATIAALVAAAVLDAHTAGRPTPRVALAAPTGKAAARLTEELRRWAGILPLPPPVRAVLEQVAAATIHRLLGRSWHADTRFRHDAAEPLQTDLVIVDESSMVALATMTKLLDAVPASASVVLVGDPDQLESVEAGSVLADVMGPAAAVELLPSSDGHDDTAPANPPVPGVHVLTQGYRFDSASGIAAFARAVRRGDAERALTVLRSGADDVSLVQPPLGTWPAAVGALGEVFARVEAGARAALAGAEAGAADAALRDSTRTKVLCATRHGPAGVRAWNAAVERSLGRGGYRNPGGWYAGRPVIVTRNHHRLEVFNGDLGIAVRTADGLRVVVGTASGRRAFPPVRLTAVETVFAMTIHKSQGSQFEEVVVALPDEPTPALSRDLLYTAVTRAAARVTVVATEAILRHTIGRRVQRVSGLRDALWP